MNEAPVLITIPHAGAKIPEEVGDRLALTPQQMIEDTDPFSRDIFTIDHATVIAGDMVRCVIDLNRTWKDLPTITPDGVVKSQTWNGFRVYKKGQQPDAGLMDELIDRYYQPFHRKIVSALTNEDVRLALDCYSMAPVGPAFGPDPGQVRPVFCLSNVAGQTSPNEWVQILADCLGETFQLEPEMVAINKPFLGGYITRLYGNWPCPWIQIVINRNLYLQDPWYDPEELLVSSDRLRNLQEAFSAAITMFLEKIKNHPTS